MKKLIVLLGVGVIIWGVANVQADTYDIVQFEISTASGDQVKPDISGNNVVWVDASDSQLHVKNLVTDVESTIATSQTHRNYSPDIDGDRIVWTDTRNLYSGTQFNDIYGYTLSTGTEFPVSTGPWGQGDNVIDGDIVLWTDQRNGNWNVWGYDFSTSTEFPVTQVNGGQRHPVGTNGEIIVYGVYYDNVDPIFNGYNIDTEEIFNITSNDIGIFDIVGNLIIKAGPGEAILYGYYLDTEIEFQISTGSVYSWNAQINEDASFIIWDDNSGGDWDIYGYDLNTQTEFPIATGLGDQMYPSISGNTVVWEMDGDIYGATIPEPGTLLLLGLGGLFLRKRKS